jgi:hypothetical protein
MIIQIKINSITGVSPYHIYLCDSSGNACFYVKTINDLPFTFEVPSPYNKSIEYLLKIVDNNGCIITNTSSYNIEN